jgi:hypothetical protein
VHVSKHREPDDYAKTAVLPPEAFPVAADESRHAAAEVAVAHGNYEEYVRSLDDVPVLRDVILVPVTNGLGDFRTGERPDIRRHARLDSHSLREQHRAELVQHYAEYAAFLNDSVGEVKRAAKRVPSKKNRAGVGKRTARAKRRNA